MDTEDGDLFIKSLAEYVRRHEKALANALQAESHGRRPSTSAGAKSGPSSSTSSLSVSQGPTASSTLAAVLAAPFRHIGSQSIRSTKLTLTPNQLYYLLSRFEELGVSVGSMSVRMENISVETPSSNYVSFLSQIPKPTGRDSDHDSIHSVSSVRSVVSSMSSMLASFNLTSEAKSEKRRLELLESLRYLYSSFTKIPCIRLINDHRARRISGYEEFPFDTAVPVLVFKNATLVEIKDVDFRAFFGWDRLSEQVRSLTVKRADLDDLADLLTNIVLDDMDKRRRRSSKTPPSPVLPIIAQSPLNRYSGLVRGISVKTLSDVDSRKPPGVSTEPERSNVQSAEPMHGSRGSGGHGSPTRPPSSHQTSIKAVPSARRYSSESSASSVTMSNIRRNNSSGLLQATTLPSSKWRFLSHLCVADNGLTSLSSTSLAPIGSTLRSLDLSSNLFIEVPEALASLTALRALNLSNCMIESVRSLSRCPLPAISVLNLRGNHIMSLVGIEKLLSLERFDVRQNRINDPAEMLRLTGMPEFRDVYVAGNPFVSKFPSYRIYVFNAFRSRPGFSREITIDSNGPSYGERRQLVDRAAEPANVPVIKRPFEEDVAAKQPSASHSVRGGSPAPDEAQGTLSRKQRTPKRRILDISQSDTGPRSPRASTERSTSAQPLFMTAKEQPSTTRETAALRLEDSPCPLPRREERHSLSTNASYGTVVDTDSEESMSRNTPTLEESSDIYKQKIEALKLDYGPGWLTGLNGHKSSLEKEMISPRSSFSVATTQLSTFNSSNI